MAVDTPRKRKAASDEEEPIPDGNISAADRAQVAGEYPLGLSAGGGGGSGVLGGLSVNIFGDGLCYTFKK